MVRAVPDGLLGTAARLAAGDRRLPPGRQGPLVHRPGAGLAARRGRARLAAGQGLAGQPSERPGAAGARRRTGGSRGLVARPADAAEPDRRSARPGRAWSGRPPAPGQAARWRPASGWSRRTGERRRTDRPWRRAHAGPGTGRGRRGLSGGRAAGDHRRRGDGGTGRDDRPGGGEGPGAVVRGLDRGGQAAGHGRHRCREADAALRLPRAAGDRQDRRGPDRGQDLLRVRPARGAGGSRGTAVRPGRRVPGRHGDQDQRADRLGTRRRTVHRRGVQPGQRGGRAERPVRQRGGPGAAQAGRG